jgi:hypothetical protein
MVTYVLPHKVIPSVRMDSGRDSGSRTHTVDGLSILPLPLGYIPVVDEARVELAPLLRLKQLPLPLGYSSLG